VELEVTKDEKIVPELKTIEISDKLKILRMKANVSSFIAFMFLEWLLCYFYPSL
jgi:hypothetical protein